MKTIDAKEWYTITEIVTMKITNGNNEDTRRQLLLRAIRGGDLKAKNVGTEQRPRYVVRGADLRAFTGKQ